MNRAYFPNVGYANCRNDRGATVVSKLLMTTYCGLSDNSVRSVDTCNLCLMYYMASLASGGFVLTNGCLNHLFQVQVQEWFHVQLQD